MLNKDLSLEIRLPFFNQFLDIVAQIQDIPLKVMVNQ